MVSCRYCKKELQMNSVKCKYHLTICSQSPDYVKMQYKETTEATEEPGSSRGPGLQSSLQVKRWKRNPVTELKQGWVAALITGHVPFNFSTNKHLRQFFMDLPGGFVPPSPRETTRDILPQMFKEAERFRFKQLEEADAITIVIDSSTNVRNSGVVNIIMATPTPVLVDVVEAKEAKTAHFYYDLTIKTIERLDARHHDLQQEGPSLREDQVPLPLDLSSKICAIATDNESTMIAFRNLMQARFPSAISVGCTAHLVNLIIKDYCKMPAVKRVLEMMLSVMNEIKNSGRKCAWEREWVKYTQEQKEQGNAVTQPGISLPCDVRWYSYSQFTKRFLASKTVLKRMQADDCFSHVELTQADFWNAVTEVSGSPGLREDLGCAISLTTANVVQ